MYIPSSLQTMDTFKNECQNSSPVLDQFNQHRIFNKPASSTSGINSRRTASHIIGDGDSNANKAPVKIVGPDDQEISSDEIIVPPDGGYGYVIVFAALMSNAIVEGIVFSFGSLKDGILQGSKDQKIAIDPSTLTWVGSVLTGVHLMMGPFVSALANKYGFRLVAIVGTLIASSAFIVCWHLNRETPNLMALILFYGVVGGIGFSCIYVPAVIAVGFYFEKKRALATGIAISGTGIGNFIFPYCIAFFTEKFRWSGAILALGLIVLLCGLLAILYKPLKPQKELKVTTSPIAIAQPPNDICDAGDTEKRQSLNDFNSNLNSASGFRKAENQVSHAGKSSASSLKGSTSSRVGMQKSRRSVPSMFHATAAKDTSNYSQIATGLAVNASVKKACSNVKVRSFLGLPDLDEDDEEPCTSEGVRTSIPDTPQHEPQQTISTVNETSNNNAAQSSRKCPEENNEKGSNLFTARKKESIITCRIGNSTMILNENTNSKIVQLASRLTLNKPMYRDDIFYTGSIMRLPDYANNDLTSQEWAVAVTSPPEYPEKDEKSKYRQCLGTSCQVVKKMLDFSLLLSPTFLILSISSMFTMLGMFVPFVYLMDQANAVLNEGKEKTSLASLTMLLSLIGAANAVGRIFSGWIADWPCVNALILNNVAVTVMGVSTLVVPFLYSYVHFVVYSCVFGISMACFASLRTIIIVDLLGLAKLTNAFGLSLLFQGIASMVATPLAGIIIKVSGSGDDDEGDFAMAFFAAGGFLVISATMCYPLNKINQWEESRKEYNVKYSVRPIQL